MQVEISSRLTKNQRLELQKNSYKTSAKILMLTISMDKDQITLKIISPKEKFTFKWLVNQ